MAHVLLVVAIDVTAVHVFRSWAMVEACWGLLRRCSTTTVLVFGSVYPCDLPGCRGRFGDTTGEEGLLHTDSRRRRPGRGTVEGAGGGFAGGRTQGCLRELAPAVGVTSKTGTDVNCLACTPTPTAYLSDLELRTRVNPLEVVRPHRTVRAVDAGNPPDQAVYGFADACR